jgi:hypothetical protein
MLTLCKLYDHCIAPRYESGTEGDSLIIAFHTPQAAVAFGAEAQVGRELPWGPRPFISSKTTCTWQHNPCPHMLHMLTTHARCCLHTAVCATILFMLSILPQVPEFNTTLLVARSLLQVALMACPWPDEVLATPLCAPVYVKVAPGFMNKSNSPSGLGSPGAKAKLAKVRVSHPTRGARGARARSVSGVKDSLYHTCLMALTLMPLPVVQDHPHPV